jgi:hypothetical protein
MQQLKQRAEPMAPLPLRHRRRYPPKPEYSAEHRYRTTKKRRRGSRLVREIARLRSRVLIQR